VFLHSISRRRDVASCAVALTLSACASGAPQYVKPQPPSPPDWTTWRGAGETLPSPPGSGEALPANWWAAFDDPVLDALQDRAVKVSPDLQTAALHFAQARVQRLSVSAQRGPSVDLTAAATAQRQSEFGAGIRLIDAIGADRDKIVPLISEPFGFYQVGFDASWELDLWGRIKSSVEQADADIARQGALLDLARVSLASDLANGFFDVRNTQRLIRVTREQIAALEDRLSIIQAQVEGGTVDGLFLERQRADLAALKSQLPPLLAREAASANQIALLVGEHPGALQNQLAPLSTDQAMPLPDLTLGLPSEVASRRPDIAAAEARLRAATAGIGVARAQLYPSIRLGAHFGYESYQGSEFLSWGSRLWSVGPSLDLPLFDRGRRKSIVRLRELEQQEAAVAYQRTVLAAWKEIDDAITAYTAERQQQIDLVAREQSARESLDLAQARYDGGAVDFVSVLDSQRSYLQARFDVVASDGRLLSQFVAINRALGNAPKLQRQPDPK
jgi:NodT family efflux transporter outer membrane factor (OMF) lipoprotein